ncbi:MAG: hypothetical protein ACXWO2_08055, partial [Candidatus Limnocylindrales bacterium]
MTLRVLPGGRRPDGTTVPDGGRPALPGLLVVGAAEIVTMAGGVRRGPAQDEGGLVEDGPPAVAAYEGRVVAVGPERDVRRQLAAAGFTDEARFTVLDARGGTVTPGLIDPHTHLL